MDRANKAQEIAAISERFSRAKAAFVIDFKGMNVEQVTSLRKKLHAHDTEMKVVRNTLAIRALKDHPKAELVLKDDFVGTNAIVYAYKDPSASAKELSKFAEEVEELEIKLGYMDGAKLDEAKIKYLSTLPSVEVLRAKFLGLLQAPAQKFVRLLNTPATNFVQVLRAHKEAKEKQG